MGAIGAHDTEDNFSCSLTFPTGIVTAHLTWTSGARKVLYTLHGPRGAITVDDDVVSVHRVVGATGVRPSSSTGARWLRARWTRATRSGSVACSTISARPSAITTTSAIKRSTRSSASRRSARPTNRRRAVRSRWRSPIQWMRCRQSVWSPPAAARTGRSAHVSVAGRRQPFRARGARGHGGGAGHLRDEPRAFRATLGQRLDNEPGAAASSGDFPSKPSTGPRAARFSSFAGRLTRRAHDDLGRHRRVSGTARSHRSTLAAGVLFRWAPRSTRSTASSRVARRGLGPQARCSTPSVDRYADAHRLIGLAIFFRESDCASRRARHSPRLDDGELRARQGRRLRHLASSGVSAPPGAGRYLSLALVLGPTVSAWIAPSDPTRPVTLFVVALIAALSNVAALRLLARARSHLAREGGGEPTMSSRRRVRAPAPPSARLDRCARAQVPRRARARGSAPRAGLAGNRLLCRHR